VDSLIKKVTENNPSGKILRGRSWQRIFDTYCRKRFEENQPVVGRRSGVGREERKSVLKMAMVLNGPLKG